MGSPIAMCGINCTLCPARQATVSDDNEARTKIALEWSKGYHTQFKPEDINCVGCGMTGVHLGFVSMCDVRACGMERGYTNCSTCDEYPCEKLDKIFKMDPSAKERLDQIIVKRSQ